MECVWPVMDSNDVTIDVPRLIVRRGSIVRRGCPLLRFSEHRHAGVCCNARGYLHCFECVEHGAARRKLLGMGYLSQSSACSKCHNSLTWDGTTGRGIGHQVTHFHVEFTCCDRSAFLHLRPLLGRLADGAGPTPTPPTPAPVPVQETPAPVAPSPTPDFTCDGVQRGSYCCSVST